MYKIKKYLKFCAGKVHVDILSYQYLDQKKQPIFNLFTRRKII